MIARHKGATKKGVKKKAHSEALCRFVAFFSPADAIPPADDPTLIERFHGIVVRLFCFLLLAPLPPPPTATAPSTSYLPPSTFGWLKYPMLLFAVVNTRKNCGDSLPLYHTILVLGIPLCSFMTEEMQKITFFGLVQFILAVTFRNPSCDLQVCGLRLVWEEFLPLIEKVPNASLPGHRHQPRGYVRRCLRDILDSIVEALSPLDAPPPRDDPQLAYRLFSIGVRLGIFVFLLHPPPATFPHESRGHLQYARVLLLFTFYLRQGIDRSVHPVHHRAPICHSMLSVAIPWIYYAASCKGTSSGQSQPGIAAVYGVVAFFVAITFRSRLRHLKLLGFEVAS